MEEETPLRRSSRSRSVTPSNMIISQVDAGERVQGMRETAVRIERFQTIREVVIEGQNEVILTSSSAGAFASGSHRDISNSMSLEAHQNAINLSQESAKKKKTTTKTADGNSTRVVKSTKKSIANGGSPAKKKSSKSQPLSESSQDESVVVTTKKSQTRTRTSTKTAPETSYTSLESYRTTRASPKASPQARKLHDDALSGKFDSENSVFLKYYKNVGEWWNYYKKTDYTYSPLSNERYELAPGMYNMPNLSRRPIGAYSSSMSRMQQNFNYALSREDSDSEEFVDPRRWRYEEEEEHRQFGFLRRISSSLLTILILMYTYTIGLVVRGISSVVSRIKSVFTARSTSENGSSGYYYYKETHTMYSDGRSAEQANGLSDKLLLFFAGIVRNWGKLLALLLLLLLAYSVYTGWCCPMLVELYEGNTFLEDTFALVRNAGAWLYDSCLATYDRTLQLLQPLWIWLNSLFSALWNLAICIVAYPFQIAIYMYGWLAAGVSTFAAQVQEPIIPSAEMAAAPKDPVATSNQDMKAAYIPPAFDVNSINIEELALKVLGTAAFKTLQSKQTTFSDEIKTHAAVFQKMSGDIGGISEKLDALNSAAETEAEQQGEKAQILTSLEGKIGELEDQLKVHYFQNAAGTDCCDKLTTEIGDLNARIVILSQPKDGDSPANAEVLANIRSQADVSEQLKERVRQLETELKAAQERILTSIDARMEETARELAELKQLKTSTATVTSTLDISDERLAALIRSQIAIYDADKTNMPDYALESSGGTVLTTRCTESYDERNAFTYYFGMDWLYKKTHRPNNPRSVIQPSVNPGDCFAFKGATGYILIDLSKTIHLTAVSMEHIPKSIAISGKIDSAPKDFSIWGYRDVLDAAPLNLGNYTYVDNGHAVQTFPVNVEHEAFKKVELFIESNHGHMDYTCIYRFRVHGVPV